MTQEEKDLLLEDLCARLLHRVKIQVNDRIETLESIDILDKVVGYDSFLSSDLEEVKPYLYPMSSMTEEQEEELIELINTGQNDNNEFMRSLCRIEFYHKYHFDYRGLIPKGLALDATGLNIY